MEKLSFYVFLLAIVLALSACTGAQSSMQKNNNRAALVTLKTAVFAGNIQFQAGTYNDEDGDGIGEYGSLGQMAGTEQCLGSWRNGEQVLPAMNSGTDDRLSFLGAEIIEGYAGYKFVLYLPCAEDGFSTNSKAGSADAINAREKFFFAYAYPDDPNRTGTKIYVLSQTGRVRELIDPAKVAANSGANVPPWWLALGNEKPSETGIALYRKTRNISWPEAKQ